MLIRCLRIDRVVQCVKNYIAREMGEKYIAPPLPILSEIFAKSTRKEPIILILSKGTDPLKDLLQLSKIAKQENDVEIVALGIAVTKVKIHQNCSLTQGAILNFF